MNNNLNNNKKKTKIIILNWVGIHDCQTWNRNYHYVSYLACLRALIFFFFICMNRTKHTCMFGVLLFGIRPWLLFFHMCLYIFDWVFICCCCYCTRSKKKIFNSFLEWKTQFKIDFVWNWLGFRLSKHSSQWNIEIITVKIRKCVYDHEFHFIETIELQATVVLLRCVISFFFFCSVLINSYIIEHLVQWHGQPMKVIFFSSPF